ncbi:MAG: hypothetical protein SXA11_05255 [Cyanobacteriota bacterium]|nr:hypothetical protein [Cyanobacteriota bacterium]
MSKLNLTNRSILDNLSQLLPDIECCEIAKQHLESCSQKIRGYWDSKNDFYEEIAFVNFPVVELVSRAIGIDRVEEQIIPWIKLKFWLKVDGGNESEIDDDIGELTLILDPNLKVVDENWSVDVESPFVVATQPKEKAIANF